MSRRMFLAGVMAGGATAALAAPPAVSLHPMPRPGISPAAQALRQRGLEEIVASAGLSGKTGLVVANARTGQVLEALNPLLPLPPASTAKAITALYGLEMLGANHRFETRLLATGPVRDGRLRGDLILAGTGDPLLDTDALGDLAAALKAAGVFEVTGRLRVHDGGWPVIRSIDPGQPDHVGYSPAVAGLNLNFNRVHFEWRRAAGGGYDVTMQARGSRYRPAVASARMEVARRDIPVYTYSDSGGIDRWSVASGALGDGGARWLPVRRPADYAAETFASIARSHGIALKQGQPLRALPAQATVLARHRSPPLTEVLRGMLRYSTNITAECVGLASGAARMGRTPQSLSQSGTAMAEWLEERTGVRKARFVDHSGLGDASRLSASDMVRALTALAGEDGLTPLLKEVPMRDDRGQVLKDHPARIRAKTGTLNFVSALAGFVEVRGRDPLVFAILSADLDMRRSLSRAQRDRPDGNRAWVGRARGLQLALIDRWSGRYG